MGTLPTTSIRLPPFFPSLISLMVSVHVKHRVYWGVLCVFFIRVQSSFVEQGCLVLHRALVLSRRQSKVFGVLFRQFTC